MSQSQQTYNPTRLRATVKQLLSDEDLSRRTYRLELLQNNATRMGDHWKGIWLVLYHQDTMTRSLLTRRYQSTGEVELMLLTMANTMA